MIKIARKDFLLPLKEKIDVMGLRIESSCHPQYEVVENQLKLKDLWNIQIAYTPYSARENIKLRENPELAEFQVSWEDELEWDKNYPCQLSVFYRKKPHSTAMHVQENKKDDVVLKLTLETSIEIDFVVPGPEPLLPEKKENNIIQSAPVQQTTGDTLTDTGKLEHAVKLLQESYDSLSQRINALELRFEEALADQRQLTTGSISGTVLDSYRLLPIPKAIIEFYQNEASEPLVKLATDWQGKYMCTQLVPGTYDIKIKHPRYASLVIKDYILIESENKYQDFLLHK